MKEDVTYFFKRFLATHPNPYCRATPKQVDSIKTALLQKIDKGLSKENFLNELGKLNGLLDGHSAIETSYLITRESDTLLLPPIVRVNSNHTLSINNTVLPATNTVTSINGYPTNKLISMMNHMLNADPDVVSRGNVERFFPILLVRLGILPPYVIRARLSHADTTFTIKGYKYGPNEQDNLFRQCRNIPLNNKKEEVGCDIYPKSGIAIVYFNTCSPQNYDTFKGKIDSIFIQIEKRNAKHLFIDNSRNEGGSSIWGRYLVDKLSHRAYTYSFYSRINVTPTTYKALCDLTTKFLKTGNGKHPSKELSDAVKEYRQLKVGAVHIDSSTTRIPAVTNGYSGKVYMLLSSCCGSSGSDAAWQFRFAKVGKILGDKSGSANPMYVYPAEFALPNSKVKFRISVREGGYVTFQGKNMAFLKEPEPDVPFNINPFKTSYSEQELLALLRLANRK
ncbi:S41 family peptidase [Alistipes sp. ZOR0009]|uniref:S41 family peptidase n=1 Tax=Alistipes sp. ZOR0009 TaxID=1339253 RepID=UPI000A98FAE9|nr:S41 family peptidase [Alistipes sp. ZOR0009]